MSGFTGKRYIIAARIWKVVYYRSCQFAEYVEISEQKYMEGGRWCARGIGAQIIPGGKLFKKIFCIGRKNAPPDRLRLSGGAPNMRFAASLQPEGDDRRKLIYVVTLPGSATGWTRVASPGRAGA